jgi:pyruvate dehydrogenase E2 component (dihydrolipoamide acetyltransferase)
MPTDLRLPLLGDIMTEGRLVSWLQPDGATVRAGQPLYELETDKVSFTVEAPGGGLLRQIVPAGEVVEVGTVVGRLLEEGQGGGHSGGQTSRQGAGRGPRRSRRAWADPGGGRSRLARGRRRRRR